MDCQYPGARRLTWTHKVVYTTDGKASVYDDISISLFVKGYLVVMEGEKEVVRAQMPSHLKDLMSDSEFYGWDKV